MRRRLATLALALAAGAAWAHPMLVVGEVAFDPDPVVAGAPATLTLTLQDTSLAEVEDAVVFVELRSGPPPEGGSVPAGEPTVATDRLAEVSPGVYQASFTAPPAGTYTLSVRDRTYRQEEAVANVSVRLGGGETGAVSFILPPTATGPTSLGSWLVWLVGVPLLAGVLVTVLVLRSGGRAAGAGEEEQAADDLPADDEPPADEPPADGPRTR